MLLKKCGSKWQAMPLKAFKRWLHCEGKRSMKKRISDMTPADKTSFLEATKTAMILEHGVEWTFIEARIQSEIDAAFDDKQFVRMDPDFRIDAAYARKEFGDKKPSLVDYMLWNLKYVTHSDVVEW